MSNIRRNARAFVFACAGFKNWQPWLMCAGVNRASMHRLLRMTEPNLGM